MRQLSERLKEARSDAGLTQEELRIKAGLKSQSIIGGLESGHRNSSKHVPAIAAALGVTALWLAEERGPKWSSASDAVRSVDPKQMLDVDFLFRCTSAVDTWLSQGGRALDKKQEIELACYIYEMFHDQEPSPTDQQLITYVERSFRRPMVAPVGG